MANCFKCGHELHAEGEFCHKCGAPAKPHPPIIDALHDIFSSKLLTLSAILFTVAVATELFFNDGLMVFELLSAIALWMTVAANRHDNVAGYKSPLKMFSAIAKIDTAIMWVISATHTISGLLLLVFQKSCLEEVEMLFSHSKATYFSMQILKVMSNSINFDYIIILSIYLLVTGLMFCAITYFIYAKIHHCAESVLSSFTLKENRISYIKTTKITILVLAVISAFGMIEALFGYPAAYISSGASVLGEITVFILLSRFDKDLKILKTPKEDEYELSKM